MQDSNTMAQVVIAKANSRSWTNSSWTDWNDTREPPVTPKKVNQVEGVTNSLNNMNINPQNKTPVKTLSSTTIEEKIFDENLLKRNEIELVTLSRSSLDACVKKEGQLKKLLRELLVESESEDEEVSVNDKQTLDYDKGDCDYILSKEFRKELRTIPEDNEGEWIAECHNRLSRLFRKFPNWRSNSVVSAAIDEGIKPDRIFGFALPSDVADFPEWTTGIHWPLLLIESKPQSYAKKWKMAIIQAYGWEQQNSILERLNLPDPYYFSEHAPLTFGVYYTGHYVKVSLYFEVEGHKFFVRIPDLAVTKKAATILRIFAVMKRYFDETYKSVLHAHKEGHWTNPQKISPSSRQLKKSSKSGNNSDNQSNSEGESEKPEPGPSGSSSGSASEALRTDHVQNLYKNHRTRVDIVTNNAQQYVVKTTRVDHGKREYIVLGHLRDLNFVPKLLNKPFFRGENITYAMSLCRGVHHCTFNTVAELQAFVKSLLLTLLQLHKRNIVHNDIKEHNILWDYATTVVSLIDFGCATTTHGETHAHTPGYCAPDRVKTPASDVYSAGIVLFNVTLRVAIRSTQQAIELSQCENLAQAMKWKLKHQAISHGEATLCSEKSLDLARRMIVKDASTRISIESALKHAFFESTTPVSPTKHIKSLTTLVLPVDNINVLA